nr:receptor-like protein kinase THESEUS 1 [Ipomoea batatas]
MGCLNGLCFACCLWCVVGVISVVCGDFSPIDGFLISCGKSRAVEGEDGRVFQPDFGNSNVGLSANSHIVVSNAGKGMSDLYGSARVFTESSTYTIRTKQGGRHWLRLHFFPVENSDYDLKLAAFSVVANGVTLLHRFSYSKLQENGPVVKEYVVEIGSDNLELILSPWPGSIAFINGIEVVSLPKGQFDSRVLPIPDGSPSVIPSSTALETVYRVNMGGPSLTPKNDTLWRDWRSDYPFLVNPAAAVNVSTNPRSVRYPAGVSVEIAPNWVYATAQEMADAQVVDPNFNLTWAFGVDPGFAYFIRMHFCDIVSDALGKLVFNVYVNEYTAVDSLDISSKTMELSAAYFIDFVVNISEGSDKLFVKVGPSTSGRVQANAILNGLEIMKLSDSSQCLDGGCIGISHNSVSSEHKKPVMVVIFACLGSIAVLVLVSVACFLYSRRSKTGEKAKVNQVSWVSFRTHAGVSETKVSAGTDTDEIDVVSNGESSDISTSTGVFSQILNPKGR